MAQPTTTSAQERLRALEIIEDESLDLTQAAALKRVSYNWLRSRVHDRSIPSFVVGQQIRVWRADLEQVS